jgi:hypothetical protein
MTVSQTVVQTSIVHLIRNSLAFVCWKARKAILPAIKAIYRAENADMTLLRLEEFEASGRCGAGRGACRAVLRLGTPHPQDDLYDERGEALPRSLRKIIN